MKAPVYQQNGKCAFEYKLKLLGTYVEVCGIQKEINQLLVDGNTCRNMGITVVPAVSNLAAHRADLDNPTFGVFREALDHLS